MTHGHEGLAEAIDKLNGIGKITEDELRELAELGQIAVIDLDDFDEDKFSALVEKMIHGDELIGSIHQLPLNDGYFKRPVSHPGIDTSNSVEVPEPNPLPRHFPDEFYETRDQSVGEGGALRAKKQGPFYDLVPFQEIADAYERVAEFGAKKYDVWNWTRGLTRKQILASLLRHAFAYMRGEEFDPDSGLLHTDHLLWNAVALCHNVKHDGPDGRRIDPNYPGTDNG